MPRIDVWWWDDNCGAHHSHKPGHNHWRSERRLVLVASVNDIRAARAVQRLMGPGKAFLAKAETPVNMLNRFTAPAWTEQREER